MAKITKDTLIAECLEINPNAPEILKVAISSLTKL